MTDDTELDYCERAVADTYRRCAEGNELKDMSELLLSERAAVRAEMVKQHQEEFIGPIFEQGRQAERARCLAIFRHHIKNARGHIVHKRIESGDNL